MDDQYMHAAIALSRRGAGTTWPNPSVGCVIIRDGIVVGQGVTAPGGRPHAETQALSMAGDLARGATAYVSLEPCAHHGQTGPCAAALTEAGIARVVIGTRDPDPRVDGAGIAMLREAGVEVVEHHLTGRIPDGPLAGFISRITRGRPSVTLKLAVTLDGRIAMADGQSQWITGEPARKDGHALRGQHDAVMVGVGTVLSDDPDLTCRIPGFRARPAPRIIADSHLRTPLTARVVATARETPTWILHRDGADAARLEALGNAGIECIETPSGAAGIDVTAALTLLGQAGLTSLMVEGGARLAGSLLRAGVVDRMVLYQAPGIIGGDGIAGVAPLGLPALTAMPRFRRVATRPAGDDLVSDFVFDPRTP